MTIVNAILGTDSSIECIIPFPRLALRRLPGLITHGLGHSVSTPCIIVVVAAYLHTHSPGRRMMYDGVIQLPQNI